MREILEKISVLCGFPPSPWENKQYGEYAIGPLSGDFRSGRKATLEQLLTSIKIAEQWPIEQHLGQEELRLLFTTATSKPTLCLCCYALSTLEDHTKVVEERLLELLDHEDELLRRFMAIALVDIGTVRALAAVVGKGGHGHAIRTQAAHDLAKMGAGARKAIPALLRLLADQKINWRSHFSAARALAAIGKPAVAPLLAQLEEDHPQVRFYSAYALSMMEPTPITNPLIEAIMAEGAP